MTDTDPVDQEYLRSLTKHAIDLIGAGALHKRAKDAKRPLERSPSRLSKWAKDAEREQNLHAPDLAALAHLFFKTHFGHAIRGDAHLPLPVIDGLIDDIKAGGTHARARDVCGIYLAHHGSHMVPSHFVVRALQIELVEQGYLYVDDWLTDNKTRAKSDGVHRAVGIANIVLDRLHVFMLRKDNSQGFQLLIGDQLLPDRKAHEAPKPVITITGQILGMTRNGVHFSRAILLKRIPDRATLKSLQDDKIVGIKPFKDWSQEAQANFRELRDRLPEPTFSDPILDPEAMKPKS